MHRSPRSKPGFSLMEVVVSMGLLAMLVVSVSTVLMSAMAMSRDNKHRLQAVDLASRELEIIRDTFGSVTRGPNQVATNQVLNPSPLPGGVAGQPLLVDGVPYTVTRTAQWASATGGAGSTCDDGTNAELAYLRVHVAVTWPGLETRPPVVMDTVLTPPKGTYSAQTGNIGVKVVDSAGQPQSGRQVTVDGGPSGTKTGFTASDGCALFAFLIPGTYKVSVSQVGYVNQQGQTPATTNLAVQSGQMVRTTIAYDRAASVLASFITSPGYALPATNDIPVTLGNSALLPAGSSAFPGTGNNRTLPNLWPYPSGYQAWAGSCLDNDPEYTEQQRKAPVPTPPGGIASVSVDLGPVDVTGPAGSSLTATHDADSACPAGQTIAMGNLDASGRLATSLPYGAWTLNTTTGATGSVIVISDAAPASVDLT